MNDGISSKLGVTIMKRSTRILLSAVIASYVISSWGSGLVLAANPAPTDTDVAVGINAQNIHDGAGQHGSVAIGENARTHIGVGNQESTLALGLTEANYPAAIAIGENTIARTGSIQIGTHNYTGKMGGTTVTTNTNGEGFLVGMTTIGTNSYNKAAFGTVTGAYSMISGLYTPTNPLLGYLYGTQNFGANIVGSLNSIESAGYYSSSAGIANSIVGVANKISNANGALIFGAGNEINNSIDDAFSASSFSNLGSAQALQDALKAAVRNSNGGGSVLAIGGGNKADYVQGTQILGLKIDVQGTQSNISRDNIFFGKQLTGNNVHDVEVIGGYNTATNSNNDIVIGERLNLNSAHNNVILGIMDTATDHNVSGAVVVGHNAKASEAGGVALGETSVASTKLGLKGYDPKTGTLSTDTGATWQSTAAAVSVGDVSNNITRQITGVAAGYKDTDAVNVAQLKQVVQSAAGIQPTVSAKDNTITVEKTGDAATGYDYKISANLTGVATTDSAIKFGGDSGDVVTTKLNQQLSVKGGVTDAAKLTDNNLGVVADGTGTLNVKLAKDLTNLDTVTVNKSVTVGSTIVGSDSVKTSTVQADAVKVGNTVSITQTGLDLGNTKIVNLQAGTQDTDGVNYGQLRSLDASINNRITNVDNKVDQLDGRVNKVGAGAAALASLHPLDFDPDDKWNFSIGFGNYKDANSLALGAFYRPDDNTMFAVGTAVGNGDDMVNASINFKVGNSKHSLSRSSMAKEIMALKDSMMQLQKENEAIKAKNAVLENRLNQLAGTKA